MGKHVLIVDGAKVAEDRGIQLVSGTNITLTSTETEGDHVVPQVEITGPAFGEAADIQPLGAALGAGASGEVADAAHVHTGPWLQDPAVHALLGWNYDPIHLTASGLAPTAVRIYLNKVLIPKTLTITNIHLLCLVAGTNYTNAQVGLYTSAGVLLSQSAVAASAGTNTFAPAGPLTIPLAAAQAVTGGPTTFVWVGIHFGTNDATAVQLGAIQTVYRAGQIGLAAATYRFGYMTGHATNPLETIGNLTPSLTVGTNAAPWVGWS
jgi:hypothetical protein